MLQNNAIYLWGHAEMKYIYIFVIKIFTKVKYDNLI